MKTITLTEQMISDDCTTFVLAGCMISVLSSFASKNHQMTATFIEQAAKVLSADPSFFERFKVKQEEIMREFEKMSHPAGRIVKPS